MTKKIRPIRPKRCDFEAAELQHGRLPAHASEAEAADRYRLVQAFALGRLLQEDGIIDGNWRLISRPSP